MRVAPIRTALRRGLSKRCPHCGHGRLFRKWFTLFRSCSACGLIYEPTHGDTWGFWVVGDRVLLLVAIGVLYLGFSPATWIGRGLFFTALIVPLVWTMPHRQGFALGLDYVLRYRWGRSGDALPPVPGDDHRNQA